METEDVRECVQRAQRGERAALEALVRRFMRPAYSVALSVVRVPAEAEDLAQESLAMAVGNINACREPERFAGYPGESFAGRVTAVLPQADVASHTLTVRIELPNRGGKLRPGMFATVSLNQGSREALLVPSEALIRTGTRTLVMLAESGGRYRPAEVRIGAESNGQTEILAGLHEGEKIVASGQFLIDSEASLTGVQARPVDAVEAGR